MISIATQYTDAYLLKNAADDFVSDWIPAENIDKALKDLLDRYSFLKVEIYNVDTLELVSVENLTSYAHSWKSDKASSDILSKLINIHQEAHKVVYDSIR